MVGLHLHLIHHLLLALMLHRHTLLPPKLNKPVSSIYAAHEALESAQKLLLESA